MHPHIQGCIFFYNPPKGEKESKALRAREENQRRVKKKGREGKLKGRRKRWGRRRGKARRREGQGEREEKGKENKSRKANGEKNRRGKEMRKMDKEANTNELRNIGISLIIHDRRLSGVYMLI